MHDRVSPAPAASPNLSPTDLSPTDPALPGETSPVSLLLPEDLAFDDWREIGRRLCRLHESVGFWIGDWWAFGEHRYGDRGASVAAGLFGRSEKTLKNAGSVARAITRSRRRDLLSFTHHAVVAGLPQEQGDALLDRAEREGLSVRALRALVRGELDGANPGPDFPQPAIPASIPPADPRQSLLEALRPQVRRHVADHGRRPAIEALDRLRREVEHGQLPPAGAASSVAV